MFEISEEEKELALNSIDYFTDKFFKCDRGKVFVKVLAGFIQVVDPDTNIVWDDAFYCDKEEFKSILQKIFQVLVKSV